MCLEYNPESQAVEFPAQRIQVAGFWIVNFFLSTILVLFVWMGWDRVTTLMVAPAGGLALVVAFMIYLQVAITRLNKQPNRGVRLDSSGLTDCAVFLSSVGFVPWHDITDVQVREGPRGKYLAVFVRDPQALVDRLSGYPRLLGKMALKRSGTPVLIEPAAVGTTYPHLEETINLFRQQYPR